MSISKMKSSQNCIDIIKHYEGFRGKAYLCPANVWTIGYGHTEGVKKGMVITESDAVALLYKDLVVYENIIKRHVKVSLTQAQFDALVCFVYNVGEGNFKSSTLLKKLNASNYKDVPEQFLRWTKAAGKELAGLVKRRKTEAKLFESGKVLFKL